jgi:hypothetical protein
MTIVGSVVLGRPLRKERSKQIEFGMLDLSYFFYIPLGFKLSVSGRLSVVRFLTFQYHFIISLEFVIFTNGNTPLVID